MNRTFSLRQMFSITRKELDGYFSSPMALIFVGVFLTITLFTFFWVDGFWARGTADVRPLFRSMPLLIIFLISALTMRQWSEEEQTGTLEILLTMPMRIVQLVLGKFIAVLVLVAVALLLTIFLPLTISSIGDLDWGPVIGGYLAALLMASAYVAIGLFVSSRTDNQIVALIMTALVAGGFHLIGTAIITDLFNSGTAELLRNLSTSGRFQSIERGVIDLRDLVYYLSLALAFLSLNVVSLDSKRWGIGEQLASYRVNTMITVSLLIFNLVVFSLLLAPINTVRLDLTADQEYTLSPVTRDLLNDLQEPLLIRGYFSEENHPLLQPLVPRAEDVLAEYEIVANDRLTVEIVDPIDDPEIETEANQVYGIRPVPLQTTDRTGSTLLNVYFDILIRYGDQTEILTFQDLIEIDQFGDGSIEVRLRDLEFDLTSSINRVVRGFQSIDSVLASLDEPASLTLYTTPQTVPEVLTDVANVIENVASDIEARSEGMFNYQVIDVSDPNDNVTPQFLADQYQIQPISSGFFSADTYYLHMVVEAGDQLQVIFPSGELSEAEIRTAIEGALKRGSSGFLQVVGIWRPPATTVNQFGQQQPTLAQYQIIQDSLLQDYDVRSVDLSTGEVPNDINVLLVISPQNMTDFERYAIDQYLMRGGQVFIAAGNYQISQNQFDGSLELLPITEGLGDMLTHYGVDVEETLVLDAQNEPFPLQVQRDLGGITVQEVQALNYPHFVDVRQDGMNMEVPFLRNLPSVTMNWVSPVNVSQETLSEGVTSTTLLESSPASWVSTSLNIQPNTELYPEYGFQVTGEQTRRPLAVALEGTFESFFVDNPPPFADESILQDDSASSANNEATEPDPVQTLASIGTLETSPPTSRLIVVGSGEFLNDNILQLSSSLSGERYLNTLQFVINSVDWFVEDAQLASIRSSGSSVRLLEPLTEAQQTQWEVINYVLALLSVIVIGVVWRLRKRTEQPMELLPNQNQPTEIATEGGTS